MDNLVSRISTIFKERYGTKLQIEWKQPSDGSRVPVFKSHWENPFVYSRTLRQVSFPLFNSKNELQGIAVASPVENKDAIIFDEMASFLQLTVAEHMILAEHHSHVLQTEEAIQLAHTNDNNVVRFKSKKDDFKTEIQFKKRKPPREPSFEPVWIYGHKDSVDPHIAFSIHDWVSNWAFINANEIPDLIWQDTNHWKNFPQITIFIPEVDKLPADKLEILKTNLKELRKEKGKKPLVVVTSQEKPADELDELRVLFKLYKSNENVPARAQAHFLLFHQEDDKPWSHVCKDTGKLFYLPFSQQPDRLH